MCINQGKLIGQHVWHLIVPGLSSVQILFIDLVLSDFLDARYSTALKHQRVVHALAQFECLNGSGKYSVLSILHTDLVTACNKQSVNKIQLYHPWHEKKLFIEKQCFARNFVRSTNIGHSTHHV